MKKTNILVIGIAMSVIFCGIVSLQAVNYGSDVMGSEATVVSRTPQQHEQQDTKILIYVLSTRDDSNWWYTGPKDLDSLIELLGSKGYAVSVEDKVSLPYINISKMLGFDQVWIVEGDHDPEPEISDSEAQDLQQFYEQGGRIWISMETDSWAEDALIFAEKFGVVDAPTVYSLSKYEHKYKPVYSEHPLFTNMSGILFDHDVGALSILNPEIQTIWFYPSTEGPTPGVAILDGTSYKKGRVIFDSGWVLGGTFNNSAVKRWGIDRAGEFPISQDLQFALNVANWLGAAAPIVSITTDEFEYSTADTMTITIDIVNPTEDSVAFQWYWGVPQYRIWLPVTTSASIPAGYDVTVDLNFTIPDWGSRPFGNVFYVQLLDATGEVLDADAACWAYSPSGEAMPEEKVDIAKEIKKTIEKVDIAKEIKKTIEMIE